MKFRIPTNWLKENNDYIFDFYGDPIYGIAWTHSNNDITLNMKIMLERTKEINMSFNKLFSICVSHEMIHSILKRDINEYSCDQFDNICYRKNPNFKEWFGGMA